MLAFDKDSQKRIFRVARARAEGKADDLMGVDEHICAILDLHPEYDDLWDQGEAAMMVQSIGGQVVNPFVHVVTHARIAGQIVNENPEFVKQTYDLLVKSGKDPHEVLHTIMAVYGDLHFRGVRQGGQFDQLEYESRLMIVQDQYSSGVE